MAEATEFMAAVVRYCDCDCDHVARRVCATHQAMKTDQKYLDDLLFYRRQRDKLNAEEGITPGG